MTTAHDVASEEEARVNAIQEARKERPSKVVRIANNGDSKVIAAFDGEEKK